MIVGNEVTAIDKSGEKLLVHALAGGKQEVFEADLVVHGAGRVPEIDDLDLTAGGVQAEERGVKVNEYLQSISNPAVYGAGDAAVSGLPQLTPVSIYGGQICRFELVKR